jgi:hypothetical protein
MSFSFDEEAIWNAAVSLAKLVKEKGRPVVLDMVKYAQLVAVAAPSSSVIDRFLNGDEEPVSADVIRLKSELDQSKEAREARAAFVETLADVFTSDDLIDQYGLMLITEIGFGMEDTGLDEGAHAYMISCFDKGACFILDL